MKLTLLGTGCPSIDYKRCGASNLVPTNKTKILIDCGSRVMQRLKKIVKKDFGKDPIIGEDLLTINI